MNRFAMILALVCCGVNVGRCAARAGEKLNVRIMTFNIRNSAAADGPNCWQNRRDMVVALIRRFNGDFVGIQEALPDQVADLRKILPEFRLIGRSRETDPKRGEATPILYRHKRWRLDARHHGTFWLSDTPQTPGSSTWGNACRRIVTWGRFVEVDTSRGIYVYNTHFDHRSEPSRKKSAALLVKYLARRTLPEPVIVTGDFNSSESDPATSYLTAETPGAPLRLVDTFRVLHPDEKHVNTAHRFRGGTTGRKIDYVLVLPDAEVCSAEILREHQDGRYPSDHYPVTAVVVFKARGSEP